MDRETRSATVHGIAESDITETLRHTNHTYTHTHTHTHTHTPITFQVPMQNVPYNIGLYFHQWTHPRLRVIFALAYLFHSFWNQR